MGYNTGQTSMANETRTVRRTVQFKFTLPTANSSHLAALVKSPNARNLQKLEISDCGFGLAGITALALVSNVHVAADGVRLSGAPADYQQRTVIAQVAGSVFSYH